MSKVIGKENGSADLSSLPAAVFGSLHGLWGSLSISTSFPGVSRRLAGRVGLVLSLATLVQLFAGPTAGHVADAYQALRTVLAMCTLGAAIVACGLGLAHGLTAPDRDQSFARRTPCTHHHAGGRPCAPELFKGRKSLRALRVWLGARRRVGCLCRWGATVRTSGSSSGPCCCAWYSGSSTLGYSLRNYFCSCDPQQQNSEHPTVLI